MSKLSKIKISIFQKFEKQNWKMTFMGPFKHEQKQSHEFWWSLPLPCRNSEAVYGHPGHNGPPLLWIGLNEQYDLEIGVLNSLTSCTYNIDPRVSKTNNQICTLSINFTWNVNSYQKAYCKYILHKDHIQINFYCQKSEKRGEFEKRKSLIFRIPY